MVQDTSAAPVTSVDDDPLAVLAKHKRRRRWPWIVLAVLLVAGLGTWLALRKKPLKHEWVTGHVSTGDVTEKVEATGTVNAITNVTVSSQVSGRVAQLHADYNQVVHRGDVLAVLDPIPFEAAVRQTQAQLAQGQANLRKAQADLALAHQNAERARQMRTRNLNAQADLDAAVAAELDAQAQVGVARANVA